jgi:hypothetical protein
MFDVGSRPCDAQITFVKRNFARVAVEKTNGATVGGADSGDHAQERGLSGPVGADNDQSFAGRKRKV